MKKKQFLLATYFLSIFLGIWTFICTPAVADEAPFALEIDYATVHEKEAPYFLAVIWVTPQEGYYAYSQHSGADVPTTLGLPHGIPPADLLYPVGHLHRDIFDPQQKVLVYQHRFPIFVRFKAKPDSPFVVQLSMLLCSKRNCIPVAQDITLDFPNTLPPLSEKTWSNAYHAALHQQNAVPNIASGSNTPIAIPFPAYEVPTDSGEKRPTTDETTWRFIPRFPQQELEHTHIGTALLFGLLAGLLLNVMPCVLPVLTMKVSSLLAASAHEKFPVRIRHFREHNILFALGILSWFAVLAFLVGGLGHAWGGLFQHIYVIYGLMLLVFLLGLSLFNVFTLPVLDFKVRVSSNPRTQAYLTGLVATLLATPCSGPLLGGILGWAALQPLPVVLIVFLATGLGMALPYCLLALFPKLATRLPKPGAWTGTMEHMVGFFLMGTTIYLLSILPEEHWLTALISLFVSALAAWTWGQWGGLRASLFQKCIVGSISLSMVCGIAWWSFSPQPEKTPWQPFQAERFLQELGQEPLLVTFTADWCPSCKVLERTVLTPEHMVPLIKSHGLRLIKVDLTRPNPEAQTLLRALGSVSIPVTAIFPKGFLANSPLVLRDLYTLDQLKKTLATLAEEGQ